MQIEDSPRRLFVDALPLLQTVLNHKELERICVQMKDTWYMERSMSQDLFMLYAMQSHALASFVYPDRMRSFQLTILGQAIQTRDVDLYGELRRAPVRIVFDELFQTLLSQPPELLRWCLEVRSETLSAEWVVRGIQDHGTCWFRTLVDSGVRIPMDAVARSFVQNGAMSITRYLVTHVPASSLQTEAISSEQPDILRFLLETQRPDTSDLVILVKVAVRIKSIEMIRILCACADTDPYHELPLAICDEAIRLNVHAVFEYIVPQIDADWIGRHEYPVRTTIVRAAVRYSNTWALEYVLRRAWPEPMYPHPWVKSIIQNVRRDMIHDLLHVLPNRDLIDRYLE
jgi:hypothetical protein